MDKILLLTIGVVGLILVITPNKYVNKIATYFLRNFGLNVETKKVSLTKFVTESVKYIGALLIAVALIVWFVFPFYSMMSSF